jgi:hypothetical protein
VTFNPWENRVSSDLESALCWCWNKITFFSMNVMCNISFWMESLSYIYVVGIRRDDREVNKSRRTTSMFDYAHGPSIKLCIILFWSHMT